MENSQADQSLGHYPTGQRWEFDAGVTRVFEDMLKRSIPQLEVMRDLVAEVAGSHVGCDGKRRVLDLGASRGDAGASVLKYMGDADELRLVEVSGPMVDVCRERFADDGRV